MITLFVLSKATRPALALLGLGLGLAGCQTNIDAPSASPGTLDFSSYVAVGNSLTAGYTDGGLYNSAQASSYPALLAQQFAATGKGPAAFVQPAFSAGKADGSGYIKLQVVNGALGPVVPSAANKFLGEQVAYTGKPLLSGQGQLEAYAGAQPDNLGVPGISVLSSYAPLTGGLAPYGLLNPFFERLLTPAEKPTKDYVTYVAQKKATFFTCWMGNNDVLTYATNGGVVSAPTVNPFDDLTDTLRFGIGYRALLQAVSQGGTAKGAVANIPNVTNIPYFTTVTVGAVAAAFKAANAASPGVFIQVAGASAGTQAVRLATSADLLTLTAQAIVATGAGSTPANFLPNKYVLDAAEIKAVTDRTTQLNAIIAKTAARYKVPLVDMNTFFTSIATRGIATNAVNNTATFATGNLFGLDGVHPTPRGYAVVANEWIRVINDYYGASVPSVNANDYRGVLLP